MLQTPASRVRHTAAAPSLRAPADRGRGQQLNRLTSLRTFGAFAVFLFHAGRWGVKALPAGLSEIGYAGVTFFFILSGFVLAWGTRPGTPARTFYWRRFARIWPSHLTMLLLACVLPVVQVARTWKIAAVNLPLLQAWFVHHDRVTFGMDGTSWSLSVEAFFYLCFPFLVLLLVRLPRVATWALAAVALAAECWTTFVFPFETYQLPLFRLPEFLLGVVAGLAFRDGWRPRIPASLALALVLVGGYISLHLTLPWADPVLAIPFLLALLAAAGRDVEGKRGWLTHRWLIFAGEVSFAFYLVHELAIVNLLGHLTQHHTVNLVITFVVAAAGATALHLLVEKPCNNLLRRVPIGASRRRQPEIPAAHTEVRAAHTEPIRLPHLAAERMAPAPRRELGAARPLS